MQIAKILALSFLLVGGVSASVAVETALPLPVALPLEATITVTNNGRVSDGMHKFALACGLLAFAFAGHQALFPRKPVLTQVTSSKD